MSTDRRGEIWLVDLGYTGKVRPCLVLSVPYGDDDRALLTVVAHTTRQRGTGYEVATNLRFLKSGVFDAQNVITVSAAKLIRRLGTLSQDDFERVTDKVREWLGL